MRPNEFQSGYYVPTLGRGTTESPLLALLQLRTALVEFGGVIFAAIAWNAAVRLHKGRIRGVMEFGVHDGIIPCIFIPHKSTSLIIAPVITMNSRV